MYGILVGSAVGDTFRLAMDLFPQCPANEVVVYTVKGNLALRIDKLATEKAAELLSPDQKIFRELALNSFVFYPDIKFGIHEPRMPHYERPEWLGGASMYLTREHVWSCLLYTSPSPRD